MQLLVQVHCNRRRGGGSLRERIAGDGRLARFDLAVQKELTPGRNPGWMTLSSTERGRAGAIKVEWDKDANQLTCRVVTRGRAPARVVGDLIAYLLKHHHKRIRALVVVPSV
jgi:hypothetical protein